MMTQLYFVYDSHCPWSYACLPLVNAIVQKYPEMELHLWHAAHYAGKDSPGARQVQTVKNDSVAKFSREYEANIADKKNSQMAANVMAWLENKQPQHALTVLNAITQNHFNKNSEMDTREDFESLLTELKLSPPNKVFKSELSNDSHQILEDVGEIQELIGMRSFPILLVATGENAVLLDHSHYLKQPTKIIEAVELELNK
jgi:protein-disulfide isomerase-like protein with CxxC motif